MLGKITQKVIFYAKTYLPIKPFPQATVDDPAKLWMIAGVLWYSNTP